MSWFSKKSANINNAKANAISVSPSISQGAVHLPVVANNAVTVQVSSGSTIGPMQGPYNIQHLPGTNGVIAPNPYGAQGQWSIGTINSTVGQAFGPDPAYIALEYLKIVIHKVFEEKSFEFRLQLIEIFRSKTFQEIDSAIRNTFSSDGLEFFKDMDDNEIINYLKITV